MNKKLETILISVFGLHKDEILPTLNKDSIGKWDSLRQMDLITSIEQEFSLSLEIQDRVQMTSVAKIIEILQSKGVELGD